MKNQCLFFDIECANCFDGEGKICSFGYVVTDMDFNVIEKSDIVINPDAEFDWALFSNISHCSLAYPKQTFYTSQLFPYFFPKIQQLFKDSKYVLGFAPKNDIGFLDYTCTRYNLELPKSVVYDVVAAFNIKEPIQMRLVKWAEHFEIDMSSLQAHNSMDDAMMSMLTLQAFCKKYNYQLENLLLRLPRIDMIKYATERRERKLKKVNSKKIRELLSKEDYPVKTNILKGEKFFLGIKSRIYGDVAVDMIKTILDNGGEIVSRVRTGVVFVIADNPQMNKSIAIRQTRKIKIITLSQLKKDILKNN